MVGNRLLAGALVVFGLGVVAAIFAFERYSDAYSWVSHTSDVRLVIGRAIGRAGHTHDCKGLANDLAELSQLTADNPVQRHRMPELRASVDRICAGQTASDLVGELADADAEERQLLAERRDRLSSAERWAISAFICTLGLAIGIALLARYLTRESERAFTMLASHTSDLLRIHDSAGRAVWASPSAKQLLGYTPEEMCAVTPIAGLGHPDDIPRMQAELERIRVPGERAQKLLYRLRDKAGAYRWFETWSDPVRDRRGRLIRFYTSGRDVTERIELANELEKIAITDELTGLLNRRGFTLMAAQQHKVAVRHGIGVAVMFADLDGLKAINDGLGHDHGDRAIKELGDVLKQTLRSSDVIARLGGDEFSALVFGVDQAGIEIVVNRLQAAVAQVNTGEGRSFKLAVSIGLALQEPGQQCALDELIATADQQMYENKRKRKSSVRDVASVGAEQ